MLNKDNFSNYMLPILAMEGNGQLTDDPADAGGATIWGITQATARAAGYTGAMADMTLTVALDIYHPTYWLDPGFDKIDAILPTLGRYLLQTGINLGSGIPGTFLQRSLNVLSNQGALYPVLTVDGVLGKRTRASLVTYLSIRTMAQDGDLVLMGAMRALTVLKYVEIAEADPSQQQFLFGWLRNRALGL